LPDSPIILTLDIGTSSVRSLLFDAQAREIPNVGDQIKYQVRTTADGGFEMDADELVELTSKALDAICAELRTAKLRPAAVAIDTFWHSVAGINDAGKPVTPILHLFDTRSAAAARELANRIDDKEQHARTGCVLHPSYYPAKLLWLSKTEPAVFSTVKRWMSFGEYLFLRLFGDAVVSTSMISGSGLWNQNENDYDSELLGVLPVSREQFAAPDEMDQARDRLRPEFAQRWPELDGIPWYPALGDGACNNVGSGCVVRELFALMVGTSGAMRAVIETDQVIIPEGLWCYRVDRKRVVLGGALSNGGSVFAWLENTLRLPEPEEFERRIREMEPGAHGLVVVPLFAGERSTGWRADARAAFAGLGAYTTPLDMARAALESVALRFKLIYDLMLTSIGEPREVIASGGALLHSPAWTQMMADALDRPVRACVEPEATSRGAALMTLERLGAIKDLGAFPPALGDTFEPSREHTSAYTEMAAKQKRLYQKLFEM
jgi:gluconokinase